MHKHLTKKLIAGLLATAMSIPATVNLAAPQSVAAYELLGETSFEEKLMPWYLTQVSPAKQDFDIREGAAHIKILQPVGEDSSIWDLQFRHRNLNFRKDHVYKVSFKVKAKRANMELSSFIGSIDGIRRYFELDGSTGEMHMGPDMGGSWGRVVNLTTEYTEFSGTFIPTEDVEGAEWTFRYAYDTNGYGGNAQSGDELWFDDMSIEDTTEPVLPPGPNKEYYTMRGNSGLDSNFISVNQLGYYQGLAKHATLGDNQSDFTRNAKKLMLKGSYEYEIVSVADNEVVYTGKTSEPVNDNDSGETVCKIDFTAFDQPGEYYLRIKGEEWRSFPFRIGNDIYSDSEHNLLTNALNYFYQNRSGAEIQQRYITSGNQAALAHKYTRDEVTGYVQKDWDSLMKGKAKDVVNNASSSFNAQGGWFCGEAFDKSMIEGGTTVWMLQNMYERAIQTEAGKAKFANGSGTAVVPETDNTVPDLLDECRYELDFMAKMKVQPEEETWGEYAGMYYHGIMGAEFVPNPKNYDLLYQSAFGVMPPSFAATLNFAACAAQGARLWAPYDAAYAKELLKEAKDAYQAFKQNYYEAAQDENYNSESLYASEVYFADGDTEVRDEAYWAACELYISAKEMNDADADTYMQDIGNLFGTYSKNAFTIPEYVNGNKGNLYTYSNSPMNSIQTAAAGSYSFALHKDLLSETQKATLETSMLKVADAYFTFAQQQGYSLPYMEYIDFTLPMGLDYVPFTGYEYNSNGMTVNNMIALAYAYDLTGDIKYINGAAMGMDYLLGNNPLAFSFITGYGAYAAKNPTHRFWQGELDGTLPYAPDGVLVSGPCAWIQDPYIKGLGFVRGEDTVSQRCYADSVGSWSTNNSLLNDNASLAWIVSFLQDEAPAFSAVSTVPGDVDNNGTVDGDDVTALTNYLLGNGVVKAPAAADLNKDGKLNAVDLTLLKRLLLKK